MAVGGGASISTTPGMHEHDNGNTNKVHDMMTTVQLVAQGLLHLPTLSTVINSVAWRRHWAPRPSTQTIGASFLWRTSGGAFLPPAL
mmetsp:Transcript_76951/g.230897  ORF Transcript_76951/g.230897 Transcript_76951/m.230897 type:complete len:87 (-) Transcript_76951:125-385(-)|eukprot:4420770-Prymnesium_polylepis.1